jgi:hypothetical protein
MPLIFPLRSVWMHCIEAWNWISMEYQYQNGMKWPPIPISLFGCMIFGVRIKGWHPILIPISRTGRFRLFISMRLHLMLHRTRSGSKEPKKSYYTYEILVPNRAAGLPLHTPWVLTSLQLHILMLLPTISQRCGLMCNSGATPFPILPVRPRVWAETWRLDVGVGELLRGHWEEREYGWVGRGGWRARRTPIAASEKLHSAGSRERSSRSLLSYRFANPVRIRRVRPSYCPASRTSRGDTGWNWPSFPNPNSVCTQTVELEARNSNSRPNSVHPNTVLVQACKNGLIG